MNKKNSDDKVVLLENIKREFEFPFQLKKFGQLRGHLMNKYVFHDKLELAIRLSSTSPACREYIGGKCYTTGYPNASLKTPGVKHQYEISDPRDAFYLTYDSSLYEKMLAANLISDPPVWEIELSDRVKEIMSTLLELMAHQHEYGVPDRMDMLAFQLLEEVVLMKKSKTPKDNYIEARIQRISHYLQLNITESVDMEKLFSENGFSRRSFYRHWSQFYNVTPHKYLLNLRLDEAARQLHASDRKIHEIAEELQFVDSAYFCLLFKKYHGVTPLQYRTLSRP